MRGLALLLPCLTATVAAGCSFSATLDVSNFTCSDGVCPAGYECNPAQMCVVPGGDDPDAGEPEPDADADAAPDRPDGAGGDDDAAVPAATCGEITLLADDFNVPGRGAQWGYQFTDNGTSLGEPGGVLQLNPVAGLSGSRYAGYGSDRAFDLTASHISVEVPHMVNTASHANAALYLFDNTNAAGRNDLMIVQENGHLYFSVHAGGSLVQEVDVLYSAVEHRFWQILEQDGQVLWQTSKTGLADDWDTRANIATPFALEHLRVELWAGTFQNEATPGFIQFENLNGGTPTGAYCKMATLHDDFGDGVPGPLWSRAFEDSGCVTSESGGVLSFSPPVSGASSSYCSYISSTAYDLHDSELVVEVTQMVTMPNGQAYVYLEDIPRNTGFVLNFNNGNLECDLHTGMSTIGAGTVAWNPVLMRFWRFAETGGQISFQTSPDGASWNTQCTASSAQIDVTGLDVTLGAGTETLIVVPPGSFRLAGVN